jgi:hypothetical protein
LRPGGVVMLHLPCTTIDGVAIGLMFSDSFGMKRVDDMLLMFDPIPSDHMYDIAHETVCWFVK